MEPRFITAPITQDFKLVVVFGERCIRRVPDLSPCFHLRGGTKSQLKYIFHFPNIPDPREQWLELPKGCHMIARGSVDRQDQ